jgi:hypothetical protein
LPFAFCLLPFAFCLLPFAFCLLPFAPDNPRVCDFRLLRAGVRPAQFARTTQK